MMAMHILSTPLDIFPSVSTIDVAIPVGAPLTFTFNISDITINESAQLTFTPLFHTPLTHPEQVSYKTELNRITVSYLRATPSLTGEYILCREPPINTSARRKRGGELQVENSPQVCGDIVTINITGTFIYLDFNRV